MMAGSLLVVGVAEAQDLELGRQLFQNNLCVQCHGEVAQGGDGPQLAGTSLTFDEVRGQVRRPRGMMPAFTVEELSDEDLFNIYSYVRSLEKSYPTWFGTDLLNMPTPDVPGEKTLEVHFSHRFSDSIADAGKERFWGLDSFAFPGFYFAYGFTDRISVYGGRTSNFATWEYGAKIGLLQEGQIDVPLAISAVVGGTFLDPDGIPNASRFTLEVPVGVRLHERFSFMAVPFFVTNPDAFDRPGSEDYSAAVGLGGTFRITPGLSFDGEWITNVGGFEREDAVDQWQAAFSIKVGGHLFQLILTNSIFTTPDFMAGGTIETGVEGNTRLGFNLVRAFSFKGSESDD